MLKRSGRGYPNIDNFIAMIFLQYGRLGLIYPPEMQKSQDFSCEEYSRLSIERWIGKHPRYEATEIGFKVENQRKKWSTWKTEKRRGTCMEGLSYLYARI